MPIAIGTIRLSVRMCMNRITHTLWTDFDEIFCVEGNWDIESTCEF